MNGDGWIELTPDADIVPGDYAILERDGKVYVKPMSLEEWPEGRQ